MIPGGRVKFGEGLKQAGIREIKEETGLDVDIVGFIGHKEIINTPDNYHRIVFFYLGKPRTLELSASDDISKAGFFAIDEIKKMKTAESVVWALRKAGFW